MSRKIPHASRFIYLFRSRNKRQPSFPRGYTLHSNQCVDIKSPYPIQLQRYREIAIEYEEKNSKCHPFSKMPSREIKKHAALVKRSTILR